MDCARCGKPLNFIRRSVKGEMFIFVVHGTLGELIGAGFDVLVPSDVMIRSPHSYDYKLEPCEKNVKDATPA